MVSEAQKRASKKYIEDNCKNKPVRFNLSKERDRQIYDHWKAQENETEYIKELIEDDMYRR